MPKRLTPALMLIGALLVLPPTMLSAEPTYRSKSLSKWLELYVNADANTAAEGQAKQAIRAIGTNAIPTLMRLVVNRNPAAQQAAKNGFDILGPIATPAIPALTNLLYATNPVTRLYAAQCLSSIGAPALPALMAGLTNGSYALATDVALSIVDLGTNAKPAVPIFLKDLQHPDHFYRERAADALGNLHIEPEVVVPALTNLLTDPSPAARFIAVKSLGQFGPAALQAVPLLLPLLNSSALDSAATEALRNIAPEVLTNAPAHQSTPPPEFLDQKHP